MRRSIRPVGLLAMLALALGCSKGQGSDTTSTAPGQTTTFKIEQPEHKWDCPYTIQLDSSFKKVTWTQTEPVDVSMGMYPCFEGSNDLKILLSSFKDGTLESVKDIEKRLSEAEANHPERAASLDIPGGKIYEIRLRQTKANRGRPFFGFFYVVKGDKVMTMSYFANDEPDIARLEDACKTVEFL